MPAKFQVLNSYMWPVATLLDSTDLQNISINIESSIGHLCSRPEFGKLFVKGQMVNFLALQNIGLYHNYSTLLLYFKGSHRPYVDKWMWLWANKSLFTKTGWAKLGLLTPVLDPCSSWVIDW